MKERPILFSGSMVRALLAGTKTQTRRVVKPQPTAIGGNGGVLQSIAPSLLPNSGQKFDVRYALDNPMAISCPYGAPGDRLWVRETWRGIVNIAPPGVYEYAVARYVPDREHCRRLEYAATHAKDDEPWRPSIHMPRWASRITLEVVGVRVERLQDISEADARAEGITDGGCINCGEHEPCGCQDPAPSARDSYCALWGEINGTGSWDENPWVWMVEFKRVEQGGAA